MRFLNFLEFYKLNNITIEDIIECIKKNGFICAKIVKNLPNIDENQCFIPLSVDDDGLITVEFEGKEYEVELRNVKRCEWKDKPKSVNENLKINDQFYGILRFLYEVKNNKIADLLLSLMNYDPYTEEINNLDIAYDYMVSYLPDSKSKGVSYNNLFTDKRRVITRVGRAIRKILDDSSKYFNRVFEEEFIFSYNEDSIVLVPQKGYSKILLVGSISKHPDVVITVGGNIYRTKLISNGELYIYGKPFGMYGDFIELERNEDLINSIGGYAEDEIRMELLKNKKVSEYKYKKINLKVEFLSPLYLVKDLDIEIFVNEFISAIKSNLSDQNIECMSGENIKWCYNSNNYASNIGKLGNSCMSDPSISKYFDFYVKNYECVSILVLRNTENKITGRSLLWKLDGGEYFMDRVYTLLDNEENIFINYAIKNNFYYRTNGDNFDYHVMKNNKVVSKILKVTLKKSEFQYYPYVDTLKYMVCPSDGASYLTNNPDDICDKELTSTRGGWN